MRRNIWLSFVGLLLSSALIYALAQGTAPANPEDEVAKQKQQILETSGILPGELFAFEGEGIFYTAAGPDNVTLEGCDWGLGAGVVEGAYAQLPRYFADTGKVEDIDSRVRSCMMNVQGIAKDDIVRTEVVSVSAFVAQQSNGYPFALDLDDPVEVAFRDAGEELFNMRGGAMDMSCAVCHDVNAGKRIRLQALADVTAEASSAHWPAYRFGNDRFWTLEDRLRTCYRNVRVSPPPLYSDVLIALETYLNHAANGAAIDAPGFVR